eukprot:38267_1
MRGNNHNHNKKRKRHPINDITNQYNTYNQRRQPTSKASKRSILNEEAIISADQHISFDIIHTHAPKNSKIKIYTTVHITGTKFANGDIIIYYQFPSNNKLNIKQKKPNKVTANWLKGQRTDISSQILNKLFKVGNEDMNGVDKHIILKNIFSELGYLKEQQEMMTKKTYKFETEELKDIEIALNKIKDANDMEELLFVQFLSREDYLMNESLIQLLEDLICNPKFRGVVLRMWDIFCDMLFQNPKPENFETAYETLRECSSPAWQQHLNAQEQNLFAAMEKVIDPTKLSHYGLDFDLVKSLLLSNMKKLFITQLKIICYNMYAADIQFKNVDLTEYQHYCFGGCVICTLLRIYYASHVSKELRFIMVYLIRRLQCANEEYKLTPKLLQLENQGGMCIMTPRLLPLNKQMLNDLWNRLQKLHTNSSQLPDYQALIASYQSNNNLFKLFTSLYTTTEYNTNKKYIQKLFKLFVEFNCTKVIWQSIKQLNLHKDDMGLRDKFKYRHLEYLERQKKNENKNNKCKDIMQIIASTDSTV